MKPYPFIRCNRVSKSFNSLKVIDDLFLDIDPGEFVSLLGPSGSGKTTLLMMLAGFEMPTEGDIWVDGRQIDRLPPHKRNMGVVFQNYALFPHLTVARNVAFPLEMRGLGRAEIEEKVERALGMVELAGLKERKPSQLSGGQQQRVALARALVFEPRVVLMDEPLGALDKRLREQMQLDIRDLHRRLGLTIVFVTHDQAEALTMSDRVAVFNKGKIEQIGTPQEIYDWPATRFVAQFIGETNLLEGTVEQSGHDGSLVRLADGRSVQVSGQAITGQSVCISLRPERIMLDGSGVRTNSFSTTVADSIYFGDHIRVQLDGPPNGLVAKAGRQRQLLSAGAEVMASFGSDDCWIVPA
ncbi:ABC transporter ATP-binding protein (plasmid) [Agrobacterium leguminum]|uniref:ABC transporter ATP-binding protein n=1 Tax=Agrobacterium TaxID=357 RepID=UPI000EB2A1B2|nr:MULTISPECIES: ABC transporter ATP-binding protein [Agrobacterium]WFS70132.1 ABC transporter ATP-binding protein [Agrobacterium leguminum]